MAEKKKMRKLFKVLIILGSIVTFIALFFLIINVVPPKKVIDKNVFIKENKNAPMLAAHRGGSMNNPENTLKAYRSAVQDFHIDIVESDIWLTKDEKIVFSHDGTIDRMSDVALFDTTKEKHNIGDYTLEELGDYFVGIGDKRFRANQIYNFIYKKRIIDIDKFSNISKDIKNHLRD